MAQCMYYRWSSIQDVAPEGDWSKRICIIWHHEKSPPLEKGARVLQSYKSMRERDCIPASTECFNILIEVSP